MVASSSRLLLTTLVLSAAVSFASSSTLDDIDSREVFEAYQNAARGPIDDSIFDSRQFQSRAEYDDLNERAPAGEEPSEIEAIARTLDDHGYKHFYAQQVREEAQGGVDARSPSPAGDSTLNEVLQRGDVAEEGAYVREPDSAEFDARDQMDAREPDISFVSRDEQVDAYVRELEVGLEGVYERDDEELGAREFSEENLERDTDQDLEARDFDDGDIYERDLDAEEVEARFLGDEDDIEARDYDDEGAYERAEHSEDVDARDLDEDLEARDEEEFELREDEDVYERDGEDLEDRDYDDENVERGEEEDVEARDDDEVYERDDEELEAREFDEELEERDGEEPEARDYDEESYERDADDLEVRDFNEDLVERSDEGSFVERDPQEGLGEEVVAREEGIIIARDVDETLVTREASEPLDAREPEQNVLDARSVNPNEETLQTRNLVEDLKARDVVIETNEARSPASPDVVERSTQDAVVGRSEGAAGVPVDLAAREPEPKVEIKIEAREPVATEGSVEARSPAGDAILVRAADEKMARSEDADDALEGRVVDGQSKFPDLSSFRSPPFVYWPNVHTL